MPTAPPGIVSVFHRRLRIRCIALCGILAGAAACPAGDGARTKKLIATGWDHPDSIRLGENRAAMEKRPFDGVVIQLTGDAGDGKRCRLRAAFADRRWEREWFRACVENLKKCRFEWFTDNFVTIGANPGNVDWFDDDGWLDELPAEMTLVDGCESAYRYNSVTEYLEAFALIKGACRRLVSPENRSKYGAQVQAAYGIYLDAYWNPKDSEWGAWYVDGKGEPQVSRLRKNLATALRLADEYVWIYGEKFRWWPTPNGRVRKESWPAALPGCEQALRFVADPDGFARAAVAAGAENLARNANFDDTADGKMPAAWRTWQDRSSKGALLRDPETGRTNRGAAKAAGVSRGCFLQTREASPGELYAVRAYLRTAGLGDPHVRIRWQTADGGWTAILRDRLFFPAETGGAWREIFGTVEVPAGAGKLVILLSFDGQETPEDAAWYDDIGLYRIRLNKYGLLNDSGPACERTFFRTSSSASIDDS